MLWNKIVFITLVALIMIPVSSFGDWPIRDNYQGYPDPVEWNWGERSGIVLETFISPSVTGIEGLKVHTGVDLYAPLNQSHIYVLGPGDTSAVSEILTSNAMLFIITDNYNDGYAHFKPSVAFYRLVNEDDNMTPDIIEGYLINKSNIWFRLPGRRLPGSM